MLTDWNLPFRVLVDSAPDGLVVCDARGQIVVVNGEAERIFGYDHDELIGQSIDLLVPDRVRGFHHRHVERYVEAPRRRPMGSTLDLHGHHKTGREFPVEVSLSPVTTERGLLIIAGVRDVSDRRRLEHEHRRMASYLASAVEAVQDAFLLFDEHDRVIMMNSAARQLLGHVGDQQVIGRSFEQLLDGTLAADIYDLGAEAREAFRARRLAYHRAPAGVLELRNRHGRHLRVIEHRTAEAGAVTMISDVTDDVERADELRRARAEAEAASAAKSEFLSSMSHELRTPLNAILGFAQLLERDRKRPLDDHQRERLGYVQRGGEHLLHLIDDVLDLARIEAGRLAISAEPVNAADVLVEVVHSLEPMAARGQIELAIAPPAGALPSLIADRTRLTQILMNFGSNAIKYGKPHGHVAFVTELGAASLRIEVRDDGIGIPADKRARIFEPFQRAGQESGSIEGTGIGLTISKRLVELMHGTIGFASEVGVGSRFWIELPIQ
ncbi:MAG TPA: PAS domain S-box protein, partial [Kofleriaceae bacterium]|nr:PAS domain S-box protein [Kofleriaceae bacterium]